MITPDIIVLNQSEYDNLIRLIYNPPQLSSRLVNAIKRLDSEGFNSTRKQTMKYKHIRPLLNRKPTNAGITAAWFLKTDAPLYSCEPKIDGLAASLIYINGIFSSAATRCEGYIREDITHHVRAIKNVPLKLLCENPPDYLEVLGEIFMPKSAFIEYNEKNPDNQFSNPRNAAAGTIRQRDPALVAQRGLMFWCHSLGECANELPDSFNDTLKLFESWGIPIVINHTVMTPENCPLYYNSILEQRNLLPIDIDGVVFKVDSKLLQLQIESTSRTPKWAIAFKFPAQEMATKVIAIDLQIGRTGVLTPVARLEPVQVGGAEVSNVTLHNLDHIQIKDIRVGDTVNIRRAGDDIPEIVNVIMELRPDNTVPFEYPTSCPDCGSQLINDGKFIVCTGGSKCDTFNKQTGREVAIQNLESKPLRFPKEEINS